MKAAFILLSGELKGADRVRRLARGAALLCADGGTRHAAALGLQPYVVIGDMDSLPKRLPPWKNTTYLCDFDPDVSDFEKCLRFCAERGFQEVRVAGASGGRLDHTMVNLALAERYSDRMRVVLTDDDTAWVMRKGTHNLACGRGSIVTLIAVEQPCRLTTSGLRYQLRRAGLERGSRGLSNVAVSRRVRITVHRGAAWVVVSAG